MSGAARGAQQHAEAGVVEHGDAVEVDVHGGAGVGVGETGEVIAEHGQRGEVDLATHVQHGAFGDAAVSADEIHAVGRLLAGIGGLDGHDGGAGERELGEVGGKDGAHAPGVRTDPQEAAEFVAATGVDGLAVAVGSSHAMLDRSAALDHELITAIAAAVGIPLVLHGSSGVPDDELRQAVAAGMVKINIGTALNIGFTGAVREYLAANESVVDPRKYLAPGRDAMASVVAHFLGVLG